MNAKTMPERERPARVDVNPQLARILLHDAINDLLTYPSGTTPWLCANLWLFEDCDDEGEDFVSLEMICSILDLDVQKVRVRVNICKDNRKRRLLNSEMDRFVDECYLD